MAQEGIGYAQNVLALMYEEGKESKQDLSLAKEYYQKAIGSGDSKAHFNLAMLYKDAKGVKQDLIKALELLKYSDLENHPRALYFIAELSESVLKDKDKALKYYEKAAYLGYKPAYVKMSKLKNEIT